MNDMQLELSAFAPDAVPANALWGSQTASSLYFFAIGNQSMPIELIHALAWVKWAAAGVNCELGLLDALRGQAIAEASRLVATGLYDAEFPLSVWQTGSGTQSNMNVNEVVATLATRLLCRSRESVIVVHPNDDVNLGQSSNDVFPTAMHIALAQLAKRDLLPSLEELREALAAKRLSIGAAIKVGRTHLQDATPMTLGQELGGYEAQLALCEASIRFALGPVHTLAIGGTAIGTGLNTHRAFGGLVAAKLSSQLDLPLSQAGNLFAAMAGHEAIVGLHASLKMLAIVLTKIGNDLRLMASGPRAGLGEISLPQNEPGSSIMPGKVNPTQIEAMAMVCAQVMGHDAAICFAASQGQFELNVYKPLIALNTIDSLHLLSDAMRSFTQHCVIGIEVNAERMNTLVQSSLMLVTALAPHIGYDASAKIAALAVERGCTLRDAALQLEFVTAEHFDLWVNPAEMLGPHGG
jgi:fumarate hydratase, class II